MTDLQLTLRIRANADGTAQIINGVGRSINNVSNQANQATSASERMAAVLQRVGHYGAVAFAGSWFSGKAKEAILLADQMTLLDSRIKIASSSLQNYQNASASLTAIALSTGSSLESNITLFGRLNKAVEGMGATYQTTLGITKTLAEGLKISGASAGEANSVMIQLSQALSSGVLRGDEFNSIMENGSRIVDALSTATGKSRGELRKMAEEGELSAKLVVDALKSQAASIHNDFGKIPLTIGAAMENVNTRFAKFIEHENNAVGLTSNLAKGLDEASQHIGLFAGAVGGLTTLAVAIGGANLAMVAFNATTRLNPLIMAATVVAAGIGMIVGRIQDLNAAWDKKITASATLDEQNKKIHDQIQLLAELKTHHGSYYDYKIAKETNALKIMVAERNQMMDMASNAAEKENALQNTATETTEKRLKSEEKLNQILEGRYRSNIISGANKYGVDPNFMLAIAQQETNSGRNIKTSSAGAQGLMQIMPETAAELARQMHTTTEKVLHDIQTNADAGALYVKQKMTELSKNGQLTVENLAAAYNAGFGNLQKARYNLASLPKPSETIPYVQGVAESYKALAKYGTDSFKAIEDGSKQAQDSAQKARDEIQKLNDAAITGAQLYNNTTEKLNEQHKNGLSDAAYAQGIKDANDALMIFVETTDAYQKHVADAKLQQDDWNMAVQQANALYSQLSTTIDQADFAQQLQDAGISAKQIGKELAQLKQYNDAVAANPGLSEETVRNYVSKMISAQDTIEQATNNSVKSSSSFMETAYKKAVENIQDAFAQMFENVLSGSALDSFNTFAENIQKSLYKAVSQGFSTALASLFDKNAQTDWTGLIIGGLTIGIKAVGAWLSKKPTAQAVSTSANSSALGSGAMHIADINATSVGHAIYLEELDNYNRRLNNATDMLTTALFTFTDVGTYLTSAVTSVVSSLTGVATTAATTATSAVSSISTYAGYVLSAIKLGYDIVKIAGNKYMTDVGKASNAAFAAESAVVAIPVVGWIAAAALRVVGSVLQIVDGEVTKGVSNLLGGHLGALLADLFSPPRTPNAWLNTFNPLNSAENPNKSNAPFSMDGLTTIYIEGQKVQIGEDGFYRAYGNQSAVLGNVTPFGATQFSIHEIPKAGANREEIIDGFKPILTALKQVDVSLSKGINAYDAKNGQAGQTMAFFNAWLNDDKNTFKNKQELSNVNSAEMISSRYGGIFDVLGASGTKTGKVLDTWYDALVGKFQKTDANYQSLILSIVNGLGNGVEMLGKIPLSLAQLVADSVKSTAQGNSVDAVLDDAGKVISVYEVVKAGLDKLGGVSNPDNIVAFLAGLNKVTVSLEEAGGNLLLYAQSLTHASDVTGSIADFAINSAQKKLNDMVQQGASKDEINGYFLSFGQFSKVFKDFGVSFSTMDLDNAASAIAKKAKTESDAAKNTIDHAIATEGLTKVSRESAIQTLLLSKKIDQATVDASEYGKAVDNASKTVFEGINFVSSLLAGTGASFDVLGLKTGDLVNVSDLLIKRFGDMKTAIAETADFIKTAFGDQAFEQYSQNQAYAEQQQILARNPDFKVYGLYAGMNSQNLQDANKAAAKATGTDNNTLIANLAAYNVVNPDLGRFVSLSKAFDPKTNPTGYKYNTDFSKTYNVPTPTTQTEADKDDAQKKAEEAAKSITDFMRPFKDASATRGMDEYQKELYQLSAAYADNKLRANELKISTDDLALITANYNADVQAVADKKAKALSEFMQTFVDSAATQGMTDYQKELYSLNQTYVKNIDAAKKLGATEQQLQLITDANNAAIKARTDALAKERQQILQNAQTSNYLIGKSDYFRQLFDNIKGFYDLIDSLAKSGGSLEEAAQLINYAFTSGTDIYNNAVRNLQQSFKSVQNDIAQRGYTLSDKIAEIFGDTTLRDTQIRRYLAQMQADNYQDQLNAIDSLYQLSMDRYNKELDAITKIRDTAKSINDFIQKFRVSESTLSPESRLSEARAQYATTLAAAQAGDADAMSKVSDTFQAAVDAFKGYYASSSPTQDFIQQGLAALTALGNVSDKTPLEQTAASTANTVNELRYLQTLIDQVNQRQTDKLHTDLANIDASNQKVLELFKGAIYNLGSTYGVKPNQIDTAVASSTKGTTYSSVWTPPAQNYDTFGWGVFDRFVVDGQWMEAAHYAKLHGKSVNEMATRVEEWLGGSAEQTAKWLRENGFAKGGYYPGGWALVGEDGSELINFNQPGQVYTAPQTRALLNSGGDNEETIEQLKEQNRLLIALIDMTQAGFNATVQQNEKQADALDSLQRKQRLAEVA